MSSDIIELMENIARKRAALRDSANYKRARRRHLSLASGVVAFLSGASMLSVLSAFLPNSDVIKLFAAMLAFTSTLITLVTQTFFDDKEIIRMLEGSAEFLALREKLQELLSSDKAMSEKGAQQVLKEIRKEYVAASRKYDNVMPEAGTSVTLARKGPPQETL